ncbi:MAG: glutamate--tRNA ligase [Methanomicrobiales archaeon]|nr:glutamate--tRNA ligase [Methanomicrobiales archaeon]
MGEDLGEVLFRYALQNAVKYGDLPKPGTVLAKVMGTHPELRPRAKEIAKLLPQAIARVEAIPADQRPTTLASLDPDLARELSEVKGERKTGLPPLEGAEKGVVMRFAPNPSGPLHLGHARAALLNDAYVRRYGGKFVLRIEDTDAKRVDPAAYDMVREDIEWLGLAVHDVVYQSDRLDLYYRYARKLIERGGAYLCTCEGDMFRELKLAKKACPCRQHTVEENLALWDAMLAGEYAEGTITIRVKTDLSHADPAMRDFSAFRIVSSPPHPRVDAIVFPLMNFSVAIDDHELGITHVIRGKDHIANTVRQGYLFGYFGWRPPVYRHYGRMGIEGVVLSTSQMHRGIDEGFYTGWDDIRLGTLRAIARRGISAEAVRAAILEIGIGETDISFSWDNLYAKNRDLVDPVANRYSFVPDPVDLNIAGAPARTAQALLHPGDPSRGYRQLPFEGRALVPRADLEGHTMIRLKDLFNITLSGSGSTLSAAYTGDALEDARKAKAPIIQWLPPGSAVPCVLRHPEGDMAGSCEAAVQSEVGKVVQFERVAFARIDTVTPAGVEAYFTHR